MRDNIERQQRYEAKWQRRKRMAMLGTFIIVPVLVGIFWITVMIPNIYEQNKAHGELVAIHDHATIQYYVGDVKQQVPANIGVTGYSEDHRLASLGANGMAPIHTHYADGVIHIESKDPDAKFTVQDFIELWGTDLTGKNYALTNHDEIIGMDHVLADGDRLRLQVS